MSDDFDKDSDNKPCLAFFIVQAQYFASPGENHIPNFHNLSPAFLQIT